MFKPHERWIPFVGVGFFVALVVGCGGGDQADMPVEVVSTEASEEVGLPPSVESPRLVRSDGSTMGTTYAITIADPPDDLPEDWQLLVEKTLRRVNDQMSTYIESSELSRFNQHATDDWFPVSTDLLLVVEKAIEISEKTEGAFDVTVGPLVNAWSFGPGKRSKEPPSDSQVAEIRRQVGYKNLETRRDPPALRKKIPGIYVDLSAIAKGYGVDQLIELVSSWGCEHAFVDIGGEDRVIGRRGDRNWRVAIEDPKEGVRQFQFAIELVNQGIATSGDYRNFFIHEGRRYSHTIDPSTGFPVKHDVALVSVLHDHCMEADAWATAMNVLGDIRGLALARELGLAVRFVLRDADGTIRVVSTENFPANIFPEP